MSDGARLRLPWKIYRRDGDWDVPVVKLKGLEGGVEDLGLEESLAIIGTQQEQVPVGELVPRRRD